jgi:pimeloyl-ACP methyl ester carboxylesterase
VAGCLAFTFPGEREGSEIHVPTLIISGRHDESTPRINEVLHNGIAGSEWVLFENSSHMAHIEEPELFLPTVQSFIERIEVQQK